MSDISNLPSLQKTAIKRLAVRVDNLIHMSTMVHTGLGLTANQSEQTVGIVLFNVLVDHTMHMHRLSSDKSQRDFFQSKLDEALLSIVEQLKNAPSSS